MDAGGFVRSPNSYKFYLLDVTKSSPNIIATVIISAKTLWNSIDIKIVTKDNTNETSKATIAISDLLSDPKKGKKLRIILTGPRSSMSPIHIITNPTTLNIQVEVVYSECKVAIAEFFVPSKTRYKRWGELPLI